VPHLNLSLTALDLAQTNLLFCLPDTALSTAAKMMNVNKTSSILIKNHADKVVGIWTEADAIKLDFTEASFQQSPIEHHMSSPLIEVNQNMPLHELLSSFTRHRIRHLLVKNNEDNMVGILGLSDMVKHQGIDVYLSHKKVRDSVNTRFKVHHSESKMVDVINGMRDTNVSATLVKMPNSDDLGIITERDVVDIIATGLTQTHAYCNASAPLLTLDIDDNLLQAYIIFKQNQVRHLIVKDALGNIFGIISMFEILADIEVAHFKQLEDVIHQRDDALKDSRKNLYLAERIIEASLDGVAITDPQLNVVTINPAFSQLTGYSVQEMLGKKINKLSSGRHSNEFYQGMWKKGKWRGEIWNKKKSGEVYLESVTIIRIGDKEDPDLHYAAIFSDITERRHDEERIQALAFYDPLTNLPNRRLFNDRLNLALSTAQRNKEKVGLLFLDLDRFKQINDTLGHSVGDELLQKAAKRIQSSIKEGDSVSRLGGDEFVVLLPRVQSDICLIGIIDRITKALNEPFVFDENEFYITTSIGAAIYPEDGDNAETLLMHADIAMYKAKDAGRNSYQLFHHDMNAATQHKMMMQNYLTTAVKNQEFTLHFQKQYLLEKHEVSDVEVLLRWSHKDMGMVSPAEFIPIAEELGVITEIEQWVLIEACHARKRWLEANIPCGRIAVNISTKHFKRGLVDSIRHALSVAELPAQYLSIEVIESCFIDDVINVKSILMELKALGISIALDDFGTGYSSLSYLTELPIDILKIDQSFVAGIEAQGKDNLLISSICAMAKGLGLAIVAEGVENQKQVEFLKRNDCDIVQGYLYCMPKEESLLWLDNE